MKKEALNVLKKAGKIAGVTCVAAGAIAIMTSATALTAIGEGIKYAKNTVEKILKETPAPHTAVAAEAAAAEEPVSE